MIWIALRREICALCIICLLFVSGCSIRSFVGRIAPQSLINAQSAVMIYRSTDSAMTQLDVMFGNLAKEQKQLVRDRMLDITEVRTPIISCREYADMTDYAVIDIRTDSESLKYPYVAIVDCYFQVYRTELFIKETMPVPDKFEPVLKRGVARILLRFDEDFHWDSSYIPVLYALSSQDRIQRWYDAQNYLWMRG